MKKNELNWPDELFEWIALLPYEALDEAQQARVRQYIEPAEYDQLHVAHVLAESAPVTDGPAIGTGLPQRRNLMLSYAWPIAAGLLLLIGLAIGYRLGSGHSAPETVVRVVHDTILKTFTPSVLADNNEDKGNLEEAVPEKVARHSNRTRNNPHKKALSMGDEHQQAEVAVAFNETLPPLPKAEPVRPVRARGRSRAGDSLESNFRYVSL